MAQPVFQVESECYIHAARAAVWKALTRLETWPRWNTEIVAARWVEGEPWQEGSIFELRHHSLFKRITATEAVLRMVSPLRSATWESEGPAIQVVNSAHLRDDGGGCLLSARHAYHGPAAHGLRLLAARQQAKLDYAMRELKGFVEGQPR
jgi:hypothetical protein